MDILRNPHGILLVTGPIGSGMSTTLYAALSELDIGDVNIITVEYQPVTRLKMVQKYT